MPVSYNSCLLVPAPFLSIQEQRTKSSDGRTLGVVYSLRIIGKIDAWKGSPQGGSLAGAGWGGPYNRFWQNSGYPADESVLAAHRLASIENKIEALRALFATEGAWLEFTSPDGSTPMKVQPRINALNFTEGSWFETVDYTIDAECDLIYVNGTPIVPMSFSELIQNATESWDIQEADVVKTYRVTHSVNAVGKRTFDSLGNQVGDPWQNAKDFVTDRLVLGWNGASAFSSNAGQFIFNNSSSASGTVNFSSLSPYNFARSENVDELGGSYSVTESWILAQGSGTDVYNVSVKRLVDDPYTTVIASIQGTIKGFYSDLFDYDHRILGANWIWDQLKGNNLYNRVSQYVSGVTLNTQAIGAALDYNPQEGSINYNYEFNNRIFNGDAFEEYTVSRKSSAEDYKTSFSIGGSIKGRKYDTDNDPTLPFQRATTLWNQLKVSPTLYNRIISSKYFPDATGIGINQSPISVSVDMNEAEGTIQYAYDFNTRANDSVYPNDDVLEEYNISRSFSRDEGRIIYTINGTIMGLSVTDVPNPRAVKFTAATGYWEYYAKPNLYSRIAQYYQTALSNTLPQVEEVEKNPTVGQVSYNYQFYNYPLPILSGALSEIISVSEENAGGDVQVIANIPIPGRALGPVLQNVSTTTAKMRSLSIETVTYPTGGPDLLTAFNLRPNYDSYVTQLAPAGGYKESDVYTWDWRGGRYSRQVRWIYE